MSRLHFRIHAAQMDLKQRLKTGKFDIEDDLEDPNEPVKEGKGAVSDDDDDDFLDAEEGPDVVGPFALKNNIKPEVFNKNITEDEALQILGSRHQETLS